MRLNAKETVGSFGGRKLIYNKIITRKIYFPLYSEGQVNEVKGVSYISHSQKI